MTTPHPAGERTVSERLADYLKVAHGEYGSIRAALLEEGLSYALPAIELLEEENRRLKAALGQIASCESHHPDDVVSVARRALSGEGEDARWMGGN